MGMADDGPLGVKVAAWVSGGFGSEPTVTFSSCGDSRRYSLPTSGATLIARKNVCISMDSLVFCALIDLDLTSRRESE